MNSRLTPNRLCTLCNTKNYMGGRDLLKDYVAACRRNGIRVGFYYSPPDWHFDRDPMSSGEFCPGIYDNMAKISDWMKRNCAAVKAGKPLPVGETASVPATASGATRYLFALPGFKGSGAYERDLLPPSDMTLTLTGASKAARVTLTSDGSELKHEYSGKTLTIALPAAKRTPLVDVVQVDLAPH